MISRLNTYFKFFIVRDPFERLISAFKDKFVKNPRFEPWYKHDIAPAIIRKYRKSHRDNDAAATGLRFEDFVRYLGDVPGRRRMDRQFGEHVIHWVTYAELCAPCDITYSVVGHHETLERDAPYILKAAGIERLVSYPTIPPGITRYNQTKVEHYFSDISKRDIRHQESLPDAFGPHCLVQTSVDAYIWGSHLFHGKLADLIQSARGSPLETPTGTEQQ